MMRSGVGRFKTEKDAARYFRMIRDGERSGDDLWAEAAQHYGGGRSDIFQVEMPDAHGNWRSFNLSAVNARSKFDIPTIEAQLRNDPDLLDRKVREWERRYDIKAGDLDSSRFRVRRILSVRKPLARLVIT